MDRSSAQRTVLIAQVTDTHVVAPGTDEEMYLDHNALLAEAVASISAERPIVDVVLATGDLTQWGAQLEYDQLQALLSPLRIPVLALPGNHDDRARFRACFPNQPWADTEHASWVRTVGHVRIVGLDTTVPGRDGGEIDGRRAAWLSAVLSAEHDGPTILAMHHPPFDTGIDWMDRSGLAGRERLADVLSDRPVVDRILCGHLHRPVTSTFAGVPADVGLATSVHVALDLAPDAPKRVVRDPVGYRIHIVGEQIVSHTRYIATGETPFQPAWALAES